MGQALEETKRGRPTVVVVIPYYNGSRWIDRAIRSVCEQTVQPDEFVIVNDGSAADERQALHELAQHYPFKIIDQENGGQGSARNAGVAASTSDYICFLDQDDYYLPGHIEYLVDALPEKDYEFGFLYADLCLADEAGNIIRQQSLDRSSHPKRTIFELLGKDMFVLPSASIIGRQAFLSVNGFDPQFRGYEDDDLFLRIFRAGYSNYFLDRSVTVWCIRTESSSRSPFMAHSRFRYFKKLVAAFPDYVGLSHFYFRDCIVPRFGNQFLWDARQAAELNGENREELNAILREFCDIVVANPTVRRKVKLKLKLKTFLITASRPKLYRLANSPGLRKL